MHRAKSLFVAAMVLALGLGGEINPAHSQQSLSQQLVGTWSFVVTAAHRKDGTKADVFGPNPNGVLMFHLDGHFVLINTRPGRPAMLPLGFTRPTAPGLLPAGRGGAPGAAGGRGGAAGRGFRSQLNKFLREEGVLVGVSSGANMVAALNLAKKLTQGVVVTILADSAAKYLSESFWTEAGDAEIWP